MSFDNLKKTYSEFRHEMRSLPLGPHRKSVKNRMSDWLERIKEEHGQEMVDRLTKQKRL